MIMKLLRRSLILLFAAVLFVAVAAFTSACTKEVTVGYSVEVYLESSEGYVLSEENSYQGDGKVGETVTVSPREISGYVFNAEHEDNVLSLVLPETGVATFKLYYDIDDAGIVDELGGTITYSANAPRGATVKGQTPSTTAAEDGTATVRESGYSIASGYKFSGWSTSSTGAVEYIAGDTIVLHGDITLYAVWNRALEDRFGGSDLIYLPSASESSAILVRGGVEHKGTLSGDIVTFTLPGGSELKAQVFESSYAFAYYQNGLAGTYTYLSSYYSPTGENPLDEADTLEVDSYGNATHYYTDELTGARTSDRGYIYYFASSGEYLFYITEGVNMGSGFMFITDTVGSTRVFSSTFGEGGVYYACSTPNGSILYYEDGNLILDGYGNIYFYDSIFTGYYYVEDIFSNGTDTFIYKIHAHVQDNAAHQAGPVLGYDVVDGWFEMQFYTVPLSDGTNAYVEPNAEINEYVGANGATLSLDGYRLFPDSAQYTTASGETYRGRYSVNSSQQGGFIITVDLSDAITGLPTGRTMQFVIDFGDSTFSLFSEMNGVDYVGLTSDNFDYSTLLVIKEEVYAGVANAVSAEIWVQSAINALSYNLAATGYVTSEVYPGGLVTMYTFTRTGLEEGFDGTEIPASMLFMLTETYDSYYYSHAIYYVFEYKYDDRTVTNYSVITEKNGDGEIWYMEIPIGGYGSLYFTADGYVYSGGLTVDTTNYYFGDVGLFAYWIEDGVYDYLFFDLALGSGGVPVTFEEIYELEQPIYHYNSNGSLDDTVLIIMRGEEALYSVDGSFDDNTMRCTVSIEGSTIFGESVYVFRNSDGVEVLRAVLVPYVFVEYGESIDIIIYYTYLSNYDVEASSSGTTLILDGYHNARLTDSKGNVTNGTFTLTIDLQAVVFTSYNGVSTYFKINGNVLEQLDGVYGSYYFNAHNEWYTLTFDGKGNVDAYLGNIHQASGLYNVLSTDELQCDIFIDLGYNVEIFTVAFGWDGCIIFDETTCGVYVSESWAVLYLDGYGEGIYYAADGSAGVTVYYDVISSDDGYITLTTADFNYYNFILDNENHTFSRPNALNGKIVYYGSDLSALIFSSNGEVNVGNNYGYYNVVDGKVRIYLYVNERYVVSEISTLPGGETYEVNGQTYYLWHRGQSVTFTGTLNIDDGRGNTLSDAATLTFTPNGEAMFYVDAEFKVGNTVYDVMVVNTYQYYLAGNTGGLALYDSVIYEYSPITEYVYNPLGVSTFTIIVDAVETVMYDGFEEEVESTLTERYVGFGPIRITDVTVSGSIHIGNGNKLEFSGAPQEKVAYGDTTLGYRYMSVFEADGTTYAIFYYKMDGDYQLFMVGTYSEIEADGYTVGIAKYFYSNEGFTFTDAANFSTVALYKGTGDDKTVYLAFNSMVNGDGTSAWLVDLGSYDVATGAGKIGSIYSIEFSETSATVTEYDFVQATGDYGGVYFFANFFVKEGEIVAPAALALNMSDGYEYLIFSSLEKSAEDENTWIFHAFDGYDYYMTILTDEDGNYLLDDTGEYWQINVYTRFNEDAQA